MWLGGVAQPDPNQEIKLGQTFLGLVFDCCLGVAGGCGPLKSNTPAMSTELETEGEPGNPQWLQLSTPGSAVFPVCAHPVEIRH